MTDNNKWKIFFTDYVLKENILNFKREIEDNNMLYDNDIFVMAKEPTSTIYKKLSNKQAETYYYKYIKNTTYDIYINHGWFRYAGKKNKNMSEKILKKYYKYIKVKDYEYRYVKKNCEDWEDDSTYYQNLYTNGPTLLNIFQDENFLDDY